MTGRAVPSNLTGMDPQARALLDRMALDGTASVQGLCPEQARALFSTTRAKYQPPMAEVSSCRTIDLPRSPEGVRVRLYRGLGTDPSLALPALLFLHGGGWMLGDLDTYDAICARIANDAGCCVASLDYRLAPENPFPAALDDARLALQWLHDSARELHIDASRIAIGGDSAGATLATASAICSRDGALPPIISQVLIYPCTDLDMKSDAFAQDWTGAPLTSESMRNYIANYVPNPVDRVDWRASPIRALSFAGCPPTLVVSAGIDPLRDDSFALSGRLEAEGSPVTHLHFSDQFHGFLPMWHVLDAADRAMDFIVRSLIDQFGTSGG